MTKSNLQTSAFITIEQISTACQKKGWKYEITTNDNGEPTIGFVVRRHNWYWFTKNSWSRGANFVERYSQNTGKSHKGRKEGYKAEEIIKSALDPNYTRIWS